MIANELQSFASKFFVWLPAIKFRLVLIAEQMAHLKLDLNPVGDFTDRIYQLNAGTVSLKCVQTAAFTAVFGPKTANQGFEFALYCCGLPVKDQQRFIESSNYIQQSRHLNQTKLNLATIGLLFLNIQRATEATLKIDQVDFCIK